MGRLNPIQEQLGSSSFSECHFLLWGHPWAIAHTDIDGSRATWHPAWDKQSRHLSSGRLWGSSHLQLRSTYNHWPGQASSSLFSLCCCETKTKRIEIANGEFVNVSFFSFDHLSCLHLAFSCNLTGILFTLFFLPLLPLFLLPSDLYSNCRAMTKWHFTHNVNFPWNALRVCDKYFTFPSLWNTYMNF